MKRREGFVSNSSTSSFVLCKTFMSDEQVKEFKEFLRNRRDSDPECETWIEETGLYFLGSIDMHDHRIIEKLESMQLDDKFAIIEETGLYFLGSMDMHDH